MSKNIKKTMFNRKKIIIISIILLIIIIFLISFILFINYKSLKVTLKENNKVEINTKLYNIDMIDSVKNGKIISKKEKVDTSKLGKKTVKIKIKNFFNKKKDFAYNINIIDTNKPKIDAKDNFTVIEGDLLDLLGSSFTTSKGFKGSVIDGITYINGILIANKAYSLPSSYYPGGLTNEFNDAFNQMKNAASNDGLNIYVVSGFRSYNTQNTLYNNYVSRDGRDAADTYSARPGHSEHQSGLAADINMVDDSFEYTAEGKWLNDNAYKYGFILRYPKGKTSETGYIFESWHYRYVGVDLATKLYNGGNWISLEDYFGITSQY